jgi:hypothetical protein
MFLRTLPVGFMASLLTAALLLSMSDLAIAQRSGVRSGVIGSAPTDSARSGVIGGGYRGAPIGRRERPVYCLDWSAVGQGLLINPDPPPPHASPQARPGS